MSDEIRELCSEINALKESESKLEGNEALNVEKFEQNAESTSDNPAFHSDEKGSSDFAMERKPERLTKRYIQNWLIDSLPWIPRKEMADSALSTSNETFRQLCWPKLHQKVKPRKIPYLKFTQIPDEFGNFRVQLRTDKQILPIASIPPLEYILGIGTIDLEFVNDEVMNFFKSIAHLLQNCTLYFTRMNKMENEVTTMRTLMEFLADKIFKFVVEANFNKFNQKFPGILDQIQSLQFWEQYEKKLHNEDIEIILNWLTKQSNYGKQKTIEFGFNYRRDFMASFIKRVKEQFFNSNTPSNFLIFYSAEWVYKEFTWENAKTNEILTLYRKMNSLFYLARYPKGQEYWKKDGEKKIHQMPDSTIINIKNA